MVKRWQRLFVYLMSIMIAVASFIPGRSVVHAEDTAGFKFNKLIVRESGSGTKVADLLSGEVPELKTGIIYTLDVEYSIPSSLQFSNTYFHLNLGDGAYIKTLPGATFTEGSISATGFEELMKTPTGTGTSPYGYPAAGSDESRNGELIYKSKNSLTNVSSQGEISFTIDSAYLNQDSNQILANLIQVKLSTDSTANVDVHSYNVKSIEAFRYNFWVDQATEVVSKGGVTSTLLASTTGGKSLTEAGSKTTLDIVYPSDIEFVSLEEVRVYHQNGTVVSTTESGGLKTTTVEWDEPGSYSGAPAFKPYLKVPVNSARANGSSFNVVLKNLKKTIWNDTPNADRTSSNEANLTVTIIDGSVPEKITTHALVDSAANWALKKYDSYNVRLGSLLIKNELAIPTKPKTLEMNIDETDTAIIRGVTIPYHRDFVYGDIHWTSASGASGAADASVLQKSGVSALITNTALGLDINDSIKSIKIDLGTIPASYDGIRPQQDLLDTWNPNNKFIADGEFYGWSYISNGVFGSWKKGTDADVKTTVKLYTTGETATAAETYNLVGKSKAPEIKNGVGSINKEQIMGGDTFRVSGRIDDANWDWNPLQEPVLYMMMPEGFSYSNLQITEGTLSAPSYVGEFEKDGERIKVWKYSVDIGEGTRGQYQPDFTSKNMTVKFDVQTNQTVKTATYHINDFFGFTTKDFAEIGAIIKPEKWDRSNWNTDQYTAVFGNSVNSGKAMVSLSERPGIKVTQAVSVGAHSTLIETKSGISFEYDNTSEDTKKNTTVVLTNGETATVRIRVRNNSGRPINHASLFIPLLNENLNFGESFMPEGENKLPLKLDKVETTSNFEIKYIKVKPNKTFALNHVPQPSDYDVVTDPADANMLMLVSKTSLGSGDGGRVDVTYKAENTLTMAYNDKADIIMPALDYDINGNRSTLTLQPAAISFRTFMITVKKEWKNHDDTVIAAPVNQVEVELFHDGTSVEKKNITAADNWTVSFDNIEQINPDTGNEYQYTVKETGLDGSNKINLAGSWYTASVSGDANNGFTITNKKSMPWEPLTPATTSKTVTKEWQGLSLTNIDAQSVTVRLYKNGVATSETALLDVNNHFATTFMNLPDTDTVAGPKNVYSIKEIDTNGTALDEGDIVTLNSKEYKVHYDGAKIINMLVNPKISVSGTKMWDDANDQDGKRPSEVIIHLYADGTDTGKVAKASENSNWNYTFDQLDTYDINGDVITYTVQEDRVADYEAPVINGTTVTNKHIPEVIDVAVEKIWIDNNDAKDMRPASVHVTLYANGQQKAVYDLVGDEDWKHIFTGLPKYSNGKKIEYTVKEGEVDKYIAEYTGDADIGLKITNTYVPTPAEVDPPVKKVIEGNPSNASTFRFHMIADDLNQPMPIGSTGGMKEATVTGSGKVEFGSFEITEEGTYKYRISEINDGIKNYIYDSTRYMITFEVKDVGGQLVADTHIEKEDGVAVNEVVFTNVYEEPTTANTPKTNDSNHIMLYGLIMSISVMLAIVVITNKKKFSLK